MMTMVRGSNPIWFEVDLTAHAFDDTFYLFILDNEIPYGPKTVWQDPFGNVEWENPIRFNANGTLPNNIYYDPDTVYRLEFRQGDTQADPLIYLVENYVPGSSGDTPIDEVTFSTDNQVSNPQFSLINFASPLALNTVSTQVINFAPGWFLHLTGTGNVTLTQVLLNSSVTDPTNASYAVKIELSGSWTNAYVAQRFERNGVLWANTFVSSSIMALSGAAPQNISARLVDSQGHELAAVLNTTPLTETFNEYRGVGSLPASVNTDFPPPTGNAYIEYQLALPNNCNITFSSVQLISGDVQITYPYEQTTIERQVDQTYHNAYPIVPVGTVIDFGGFDVPAHYLFCDGTAYNRIEKNLLFQALTTTETVTLTASSNTFTVTSGARYRIGMGVENAAIPANTTIIGISTNTITISSPATVTGAASVRFFAAATTYSETVSLTNGVATFTVASAVNYGIGMAITGAAIQSNTVITNIVGTTITMSKTATATQSSVVTFWAGGNGNGTTTFNVYNLQDFVIAGAGPGGSLYGTGTSGLGAKVGSATHTLLAGELPPHSHTYSTVTSDGVFGFGFASGTLISSKSFNTGNGPGSSTPFSIVQQTALLNKCIRFE